MKKIIKHVYLLALMLLCSLGGKAQEANILKLTDIRGNMAGKVSLPISIDNTCNDIVAFQFRLQVPQGVTIDTQSAQFTSRTESHSAIIQPNANGYVIMAFSPDNKPIVGNSGKVMTIDLNIGTNFEPDDTCDLVMSQVLISDRQGNNVLTNHIDSKLIIGEVTDFIVTDIDVSGNSYIPGKSIPVSWVVKNQGGQSSTGGWSELVSLIGNDGRKQLLGTVYYDGTLGTNSSISRQADFIIPALPGIEGNAKIEVRIQPNADSGELSGHQSNNTTIGTKEITLEKALLLVVPSKVEESNLSLRCQLGRSGNWSEAQTFNISIQGDSRITCPTTVTIPQGQSSAYFYLTMTDDNNINEDSIFMVTAEGNGYASTTSQIVIEDNEYPSLGISTSKSEVTEGETFQLTISTPQPQQDPITVTLASEDNKRFSFPAQVVIPAGGSSLTVDVVAVGNDIPDVELSNKFTVSAPRYNSGEVIVLLSDDDMPVLQLTLTPDKVSENAGPLSVSGVLRRMTNQDKKITVKLADDANGGVYYANNVIEMAKGVDEMCFNLGPIDNDIVEGDRVYTITASVYVSSCSCNATGESAGAVSSQLEVFDNDGPTLSMRSSASTVKEGQAVMLTIGHNTSTTEPLSVHLTSDHDDILEYTHDIVIPAGERNITINVQTVSNGITGDSKIVVFMAEADNMGMGTCYLNVADQTMPDVRISDISMDKESVVVGEDATMTIELVNDGLAELPRDIMVKVYRKGEASAIAAHYTEKALSIGEKATLTIPIAMPKAVGRHRYYAIVNDNHEISELSYTNNTSAEVVVNVTSPFTATVSTDKNIYAQGETVAISGQLLGEDIANTEVEVYIIHDGARMTKTLQTDAQGMFSTEWELYALQSGHFSVGACYNGEGLSEAMASFDVYGLKRANNSYITCDVTLGETYEGNIPLINPGVLALTDVRVEVLSAPENCIVSLDIPTSIAGSETVQLSYTLTGTSATTENKWDEVKARVTTAEGASLDITLYFYCRNAQAKLVASTKSLVTTMTKGKAREYSIQVTNIGKGNTGAITLSLPEWMNSLSGNTLTSMNQNDTATIVLLLTPTDDMHLNVPVTGRFGINCENGDGTYVSFNITPVSEETGMLVVDVTDEYTYYTAEAPHVEGAQVVIRNPITKALVAQGRTGTDGMFEITLTEGYYQLNVTADRHDSYTNSFYVDPGTETRKVVNLSVQGITVDWTVEETEVEDKYEIVTSITYETNVPAPVVVLDVPRRIDGANLKEGESLVFNAILTNKGLINAEDAELAFAEQTGSFVWEPLAQNYGLTIAPQQSIVIPIKLTRLHRSSAGIRPRKANASSEEGCVATLMPKYQYVCGPDRKIHYYQVLLPYTICPSSTPPSVGPDDGKPWFVPWDIPWWKPKPINPPTPPAKPNKPGNEEYKKEKDKKDPGIPIKDALFDCDPCLSQKIPQWIDCIAGFIPQLDMIMCAKGLYDCFTGDSHSWRHGINCILSLISCAATKPTIGIITNIASCLINLSEPCDEGGQNGGPMAVRARASSEPSYVTQMRNVANIGLQDINGYMDVLIEFFGDSIWVTSTSPEEMASLLIPIAESEDYILDANKLRPYKPSLISNSQFDRFVERLNNTSSFEQTGEDASNRIHHEEMEQAAARMDDAEQQAVAMGYEDVNEMLQVEAKNFLDKIEEKSSSVCASITLLFSQSIVMTRQAFRGTLTVFNGHETDAMTDVKLTLNMSSKDGKVATSHEFQINPEALKGFVGELDLKNGWSLAAGETGTATILFIPTKYAAPTEPVDYSFGGTLSYIDPFTGLEVKRELYPVTLTVKPSPELDLDYFMQRDIYGDDPLTEEIEPIQPAEFVLLINNKGYGDATNVRMTTMQPEIIDNEKGLLIDFELLSSQVNGEEANLAFGQSITNDFGTIVSQSQTYAQWWLQSSLLGHFTEYSVNANHVTSYGNEDLSLINQVNIHELIHGFTHSSLEGKRRGFLVNDIPDKKDFPDAIYFTDATNQPVTNVQNVIITKRSDTEYALTMIPSVNGWTYGAVNDPTNGKAKPVSIIRESDGVVIDLDNVWQTDRTLRDGKEPLYENLLHFVADLSSGPETYLITMNSIPTTELAVDRIDGVPQEEDILDTQLTSITVTFNKPIDATTFTSDDLTINCQGNKVSLSSVEIVPNGNREFVILFHDATLDSGFYTLSVQTKDIIDQEGYYGALGKTVSWTQYPDGKVILKVMASPVEGGIVTPSSGKVERCSEVSLTAIPAEGYMFYRWLHYDNPIEEGETFNYTPMDDEEFTAEFIPIIFENPENDADREAYAVLSPDNTTLTFYYDGKKGTRDGMVYELNKGYEYPEWYNEHRTDITNVVFDKSFSKARPTSTYRWFAVVSNETSNLTEIKGIQNLNTSNVTSMSSMFAGCSGLTSLDLSHFDTGNVTDMSAMFSGCSSLTSLDLSHFDTGNVTNMIAMFSRCSSLTSLDLSHFDTGNVTEMDLMFYGCSSLTSLDLSHFDTGNVTSMRIMFYGCSSLTSLDVSKFNTGNVTNMDVMFWGCKSLTSLDVSKFDTGNVTDMSYLFYGCSSLTSLDVSHFDTGNVTNMRSMFKGCSSLTSLDLSKFNTGNVTNMDEMFVDCSSLTSLDVSKFNTGNVTNMYCLFYGCSSLTSLDVSHFDTGNVTNMSWMFSYCGSLTSLDLSRFDTGNVTDMRYMFSGCSSLKILRISSTMGNISDNACNGVGSSSSPCSIIAPKGFNFGTDTSGNYFMWAGGYFCLGYAPGDVNHDDVVNITDVIMVVNDIMGMTPNNYFREEADVNGDHTINVTDIINIINIILNTEVAMVPTNARLQMSDIITLADSPEGYVINLENHDKYTGLQMDVSLPENTYLKTVWMENNRSNAHKVAFSKTTNNRYRIVIYSLDGNELKGNEGILLHLNVVGGQHKQASIGSIMMTNQFYETVVLPDVDVATGIDNPKSSNDTAPSFTIQGIKTSKYSRGIILHKGRKYIRK